MSRYPDAAGIVVFRLIDNQYHVLVLHGLRGDLDIPKGVCDPGEDTLTAALRETEEEAGLTDLYFPLEHINECFDSLYVYIAITEQEVNITPNPKSGIIEHLGYEWMDIESAKNAEWSLYLKHAIGWALEKTQEFDKQNHNKKGGRKN